MTARKLFTKSRIAGIDIPAHTTCLKRSKALINDTNNPVLYRHGEHVSPDYVDSMGVAGVAGRSTDAERPDGHVSGLIKRFAKDIQAAQTPTSLNLLKTRFQDAIEFTGITHQTRGSSALIGLFPAAMALGVGAPLIRVLTEDGFENLFDLFLAAILLSVIAFGLKVTARSMRVEFFRPEDEPIIFDRKHRKVYALMRVMQPGWKGLFRHWPINAAEYDWDLIDPEHHAVVSATGSTIHRYHNLIFLVKRSATDPTIIDSFQIGNSLQVGAESAAPLWEHIRRFMELGGPHLPAGEFPIAAKAPTTLWESMGAVGPIGPRYMSYWRDNPVFMVFMHVLFPLFVPMLLFCGLFNWLSYKTAIPVQWPKEVLDAIGLPTAPPVSNCCETPSSV